MLYYMQTETIAIVVPCFNEARRLDPGKFSTFLSEHRTAKIVFVNDGSTDNTMRILEDIRSSFASNSEIISFKKNRGKSSAVREGVGHIIRNHNTAYIGYLDSDLSTGLEEYQRIFGELILKNASYAFGSRILMENTRIRRNAWRHATGRIITTIVDLRYHLGIYDTQCGAKIFESAMAREIFRQPFHSNWLFDVEIFIRLRKKFPEARGLEIPLTEWREKKDPN